MFSAAQSAGLNRPDWQIHTNGAVGILAAFWSIVLFIAVPDFKILEKLRNRITKMTEGRWGKLISWYVSMIAYFAGLIINLASLAGKGLPAFYFIIFYIVGLVIFIFLFIEPRLMRR